MRVTTEKIVFGGKALARVDGKTVFIPFALPDEELDITVTVNKRDYSEAAIKKVLTPSPHRIEPPCPYFGHCGGCNLQIADDDFQQSLRQIMVAELFDRAHITPERPPIFIAGPAWEYRNRFQFHTDKNGTIGMHGVSSNTVIPVRDCPIAAPALRTVLQQGGLQKLFPHNKKMDKDRLHVFAQDAVVYSPVRPNASARVNGTVLNFNVFGFFQSNIAVLEKLIEPVSDLPRCTRILDFYAGVGTFSAFLTGKVAELHLVEHNERALITAPADAFSIQFPMPIGRISPLHNSLMMPSLSTPRGRVSMNESLSIWGKRKFRVFTMFPATPQPLSAMQKN